jgi:hypothetical protein
MLLRMFDVRLVSLLVLIVLCVAATILVIWRRWELGLLPCLVLALVLRLVVAYLARPFTPVDVGVAFHAAGNQIALGKDPTLTLPNHEWNFLPFLPYLWSVLRLVPLPWVYAVKIPVIACDVINVWLVGLLASTHAGTKRLLYAISPVAVIVASLHGQIEPISLAFLLGGIVALRKEIDVVAGLLFGFAIATNNWPVLPVAAILLGLPRQRSYKIVPPAFVVLISFFLSSVIFLGSSPLKLAHAMATYSSFAGTWGWTGTLFALGHKNFFGYSSPAVLPGDILIVIAVAFAILGFRRSSDLTRAWTAPMALLMVTPGFGAQYLLWPLPMAIASDAEIGLYTLAATGYFLPIYLGNTVIPGVLPFLAGLSWLVIAVMGYMLWRAFKREDTARGVMRQAVDDTEAGR